MSDREAVVANQRFYDGLWSAARLVHPERFNTWPIAKALATTAARRLEIGPGLRPRLPALGTHFVDISQSAVQRLRPLGGLVIRAEATALPYPDQGFDLVCALDIVEHVGDDTRLLAEIARVLRPGGTVMLSVPLHQAQWTEFDALVGHLRRYEPAALVAMLTRHGLAVERSAVYGMQPRSRTLAKLGAWWLTNHRAHAMQWYNRVFMPVALFLEKALQFGPGVIETTGVDEIILICRRGDGPVATGATRRVSALRPLSA